jgi:hypothetical protein
MQHSHVWQLVTFLMDGHKSCDGLSTWLHVIHTQWKFLVKKRILREEVLSDTQKAVAYHQLLPNAVVRALVLIRVTAVNIYVPGKFHASLVVLWIHRLQNTDTYNTPLQIQQDTWHHTHSATDKATATWWYRHGRTPHSQSAIDMAGHMVLQTWHARRHHSRKMLQTWHDIWHHTVTLLWRHATYSHATYLIAQKYLLVFQLGKNILNDCFQLPAGLGEDKFKLQDFTKI